MFGSSKHCLGQLSFSTQYLIGVAVFALYLLWSLIGLSAYFFAACVTCRWRRQSVCLLCFSVYEYALCTPPFSPLQMSALLDGFLSRGGLEFVDAFEVVRSERD